MSTRRGLIVRGLMEFYSLNDIVSNKLSNFWLGGGYAQRKQHDVQRVIKCCLVYYFIDLTVMKQNCWSMKDVSVTDRTFGGLKITDSAAKMLSME